MPDDNNNGSITAQRGCMAIFLAFILTPFAIWGIIALDIHFLLDSIKIFSALFFFVCCIIIYKFIFTNTIVIDSNKISKEKEIEKNKFYYFCDIIDGKNNIGVLEIKHLSINVKYNNSETPGFNCQLSSIISIESINSENVNLKHGAGSMVLGGIVAGPLGAAIGASAGVLLRESKFLIGFDDGNVIACKSLSKTFDDFISYYKIKMALASRQEAISPLPATPTPHLPENLSSNTETEMENRNGIQATIGKKVDFPVNIKKI